MLNEVQLGRKLALQTHMEWDILKDIDWSQGVDLDKDLLPLSPLAKEFTERHEISTRSVSWMFGLLATSAISEHERVLNDLHNTWESGLRKDFASLQLLQLGNQFFKEEMKHSEAFKMYLEHSAIFLNLKIGELKSFLPRYTESSLAARLYRKDLMTGGSALWWTVATTEEESIELFRMLNKNADRTDPLFYQLNKLHYEEEIRHSSFSYMMIDFYSSKQSRSRNISSYLLARSLQTVWVCQQLKRLRNVHQFADRHPYLSEMSRFVKTLEEVPFFRKMKLLYQDNGYVSMMLKPENHMRIRKQISKSCFLINNWNKT